jgi:hypothetical protein
MNDLEHKRRGEDAQRIIDSPLWAEAWEAYRTRLLHLMETADSSAQEQLMQAKRLLTAGTAAKAYLERLIVDGKVSAESIRMDEERKKAKWWPRSA